MREKCDHSEPSPAITPKSFRGKAVIIIQPQDETGEVTIKVTSPNLKSAEYKLRITK